MLTAIRVDGNSSIGLGHWIRMRTLSLALRSLGAKVIFFSRDKLDLAPGFELVSVPLGLTVERECAWIRGELERSNADMLVVDSYAYGEKELALVAGFPQVSVYIDDLNRHPFEVDFVINGNLYAEDFNYRGKARFLLGSEYLLLRPEFTVAKKIDRSSKPVQDILVMLGGGDLTNTTPKLLYMLKNHPRFAAISWHVVIGPAYTNREEIEQAAAGSKNISCLVNPALERVIPQCDLAISAAGSSIYELAAVGVPALAVIIADNQTFLASKAHSIGLAVNLGWYDVLAEEELFKSLNLLLDNHELRSQMSLKGPQLVTGQGALNAAQALLQSLG